MLNRLVLIFFLVLPYWLKSQFAVYPLDERYNNILTLLLVSDTSINLSFNPLIVKDIDNSYTTFSYHGKSKLIKYLFFNNNFDYTGQDFSMHLNLLGNYSVGTVKGDTIDYYRNTRGFEIFGNLGKKIFYYTKFLENQAVFVPYVDAYIDTMFVVPGEGWWKPFGDNGRDYTYASGYLTINPFDNFFIELGHGKNFIGTGYRSLILSDNSFVYPYLKMYYRKGHWSLYSLWMQNYMFHTRYYFYHYSKHTSYNAVSYSDDHLNLSLLVATVWKTSDYTSYVNHFSPWFFVPFSSSLIYGLDGKNNVLLALDFNYRYKTFLLYGQLVADKIEINRPFLSSDNRFAYQIGMRTYDLFFNHFSFMSLRLLSEYNLVRPYTYSASYLYQGFYHYNQLLTHPLGAGFKEYVFRTTWNLWNISIDYQFSNGIISLSGLADVFSDTHQYYPHLTIGEPNPVRIRHNTLRFSFLLNSHTGLRIYFLLGKRNWKTQTENKETFYKFVGLTTDLGRFYYDF